MGDALFPTLHSKHRTLSAQMHSSTLGHVTRYANQEHLILSRDDYNTRIQEERAIEDFTS